MRIAIDVVTEVGGTRENENNHRAFGIRDRPRRPSGSVGPDVLDGDQAAPYGGVEHIPDMAEEEQPLRPTNGVLCSRAGVMATADSAIAVSRVFSGKLLRRLLYLLLFRQADDELYQL